MTIKRLQRQEAEHILGLSEELGLAMLDSILGAAAIIASNGQIIAVNESWRRWAKPDTSSPLHNTGTHKNYLQICRQAIASGDDIAAEALVGINAVIRGNSKHFSMEHALDIPPSSPWSHFFAISLGTEMNGVLVCHTETPFGSQYRESPFDDRLGRETSSFLQALVRSLARVLGVKHSEVGELLDDRTYLVVAHWDGGGFSHGEEYEIPDSPWQITGTEGFVSRSSNVLQELPNNRWLQQRKANGFAGVPILDSHGAIIGQLAVANDEPLTDPIPIEPILRLFAVQASGRLERKRRDSERDMLLDRALRAEAYYRALFEGVADAVIVVSEDLRLTNVNKSTEDLLQYSRDELLRMTVYDIMGETREWTDTQVALLRDQRTWQGEARLRRSDNKSIPVEARVSIVDFPDGATYISVVRDMSERKRGIELRRRANASNLALIEAIPDLMFRLSGDGTFLDFWPSKDFEPIVSESECMGRRLIDVLPPNVAERSMKAIAECLATGALQTFEYQMEKDGHTQSRECRITRMSDNEVLAIVRDRTAEKHKAEEAERRQEVDELENKVEGQLLRANPYHLTFREFTVLHYLVQGVPDKEIARRLYISIFTVNKHVANILSKMQAASRTEAAVRAQREGLLAGSVAPALAETAQ